MKKIFWYLIIGILLSGCDGNEANVPQPGTSDSLAISVKKIVFSAKGGEETFDIVSNTDWMIANIPSWLETDPVKGKGKCAVKVVAKENTAYDDKIDTIIISTKQVSESLVVYLKRINAIVLDENKYFISGKEQEVKVGVNTNIPFNVKIENKDQVWVENISTKALEPSFLIFHVKANEAYEKRLAKIVLEDTEKKITDTIYLEQASKTDMIIQKKYFEVSAKGGDIVVEVESNLDYECVIAPEYKDWIKPKITTKGLEKKNLGFTISPNVTDGVRNGEIIFKAGYDYSDTVKIEQAISDVYVGDVTLSTLKEMEDFRDRGYTKITGTLSIVNDEITTLAALGNQIDSIGLALVIGCKSLEKLEGLSNLRTIGEDLFFAGSNIRNFEGLNNLVSIAGNFSLDCRGDALPKLESFKGFDKLKTIGKDFRFWSDQSFTFNALKSFEGLESLVSIGGNFQLYPNSKSSITDFNALTSFKGLDNLRSIGGDFLLEVNAGAEAHCFESLASFDGLNKLEEIGGKFNIVCLLDVNSTKTSDFMRVLTSFKGLDKLTVIKDEFEIIFRGGGRTYGFFENIKNFEGLGELTEVGGNIIIQGDSELGVPLTNLSSFQGLGKLNLIGGHLMLAGNMDALASFAGLTSLKEIGENLSMRGYYKNFTSFEGLSSLQKINGSFSLVSSKVKSTFCKLSSFKGLEQLTYVGKDFELRQDASASIEVEAFESLYSLKGLEKLEEVHRDLYLIKNKHIKTLDGLEGIKTIGGGLIISSYWSLSDLGALANLEFINNLEITKNDDLSDFCVLKNVLKNMPGTFKVTQNKYNPTKSQIIDGSCSQ